MIMRYIVDTDNNGLYHILDTVTLRYVGEHYEGYEQALYECSYMNDNYFNGDE